jgi:uncharacterized protein YutE (UPF0331/DUF86 family)
VDHSVPAGASLHQDILDQMSADVAGLRPALLDFQLHEALTELKGFRHVVRHRYGMEMRPEKVIENIVLLQDAFPAFVRAVSELEQSLKNRDI